MGQVFLQFIMDTDSVYYPGFVKSLFAATTLCVRAEEANIY